MRIELIDQAMKDVVCDTLIISGARVEDGQESLVLFRSTKEVDQALDGLITTMYADGDFKGNVGETVIIYTMGKLAARRVILVGLGKAGKFQPHICRRATGIAVKLAQSKGARQVAVALGESTPQALQDTVEGALLGAYSFRTYLSAQQGEKPRIESISLVNMHAQSQEQQEALRRGSVMAEATNFARDLVNEQPAVLTPGELANCANTMARDFGLECTILEPPQMEELGMGGLLAVGKGSAQPPRFIILRYRGAPDTEKAIALVGKGITFDTGGISIKPAVGMESMKGDMGGGAAVLGAMRVIGALKPQINVLGLVPSAENMPDGAAYRPGDILRLMNGKTIEIVNTDAEGRLALADGLSYAVKEGCSPIVDIATLTGACYVALGGKRGGLFCNDDALSAQLMAAGEATGEKLWPLPIDEEYGENIKSHIADIKQTGGRYGGAMSAAKILEHFVGEASWAHLDIAGTEFVEEQQPFMEKGATGFGARALAELILRRAEK